MIERLLGYVGNVQIKAINILIIVGGHKEDLLSIGRELDKNLNSTEENIRI